MKSILREYISEHDCAKVYASSMVRDLREDSAELLAYRIYFNYFADNMDTLMQILSYTEIKNIPTGKYIGMDFYACQRHPRRLAA